jgi:glycosyltransferase involved in cell wall biosynthesis
VAASHLAGPGRIVTRKSVTALAWTRFQPRTVALAAELGGQARFFGDGFTGTSIWARPLAYFIKAIRTWRTLSQDDPGTVVVITPPVFAPMIAWLWCGLRRRKLVVDCHTGAFHSKRWSWARPLHRWLLTRADAVLLHTAEIEELVRQWGVRTMVVPDDVPDVREASPVAARQAPTVVVAGSFDANEPVAEAIEAARLLPDVEFRFTGDAGLVPENVRAAAPANAILTGYLAYPLFLGELLAADVVAVFSTDPRIMNRAAFEAVGLGRPLVLSDLPALKTRFGAAALFCPNDPAGMAAAIEQAIARKDELGRLSVNLQTQLIAQRRDAVEHLQKILDGKVEPVWRQQNAS